MIDAIADKYLDINCACFTPNQGRTTTSCGWPRVRNADGVIDYTLHFCTPTRSRRPRSSGRPRAAGIPSLRSTPTTRRGHRPAVHPRRGVPGDDRVRATRPESSLGSLRCRPRDLPRQRRHQLAETTPVAQAMMRFLGEVGANPGRSGHRLSIEAGRVVYRAREAVAGLLGVADPMRIIFCANATHALNLALRGLLGPGQHVVTTSMEHNSVMRPLRALEAEGIALTVVECSPEGILDPAAVKQALRPETTLIVMTHASNVVGTLMPVREVAEIARAHDLLLLVDGAQSVGALPIDMDATRRGAPRPSPDTRPCAEPTGTGGLIIGERVDIASSSRSARRNRQRLRVGPPAGFPAGQVRERHHERRWAGRTGGRAALVGRAGPGGTA